MEVTWHAPGVPGQYLGGINPAEKDKLNREAVLDLHTLDVRRMVVASAGMLVLMLFNGLFHRPVMNGRQRGVNWHAGHADRGHHQEQKQPPYDQAHCSQRFPLATPDMAPSPSSIDRGKRTVNVPSSGARSCDRGDGAVCRSDVRTTSAPSETRGWMAFVMGACMAVIMLSFMMKMYNNRTVNLAIFGGAVALFALSLWLADEILHLGDLPLLRLDDFVGELAHARIGNLGPLAGQDRDRMVRNHGLHVLNVVHRGLTAHSDLEARD